MNVVLDVDPALCEAVVEEAARIGRSTGVDSFDRALRRALDPLYDGPLASRGPSFLAAYRRLFTGWGYETFLRRALDEFPALFQGGGATGVAFRAAARDGEAGADLGGPARSLAGISVPVGLFRDPMALLRFLRHELQHLADMLDPAFAYARVPGSLLGTATTENAVRERLRILWSINVDGRIDARALPPMRALEDWVALLRRALPDLAAETTRACATSLWNRGLVPFPVLLDMARKPARKLGGLDGIAGFVAGDPCPLCRFPVRQLAPLPPALLREEDLVSIREAVPGFDPKMGACERCIEGFSAAARN
jgi:hypothetical protein